MWKATKGYKRRVMRCYVWIVECACLINLMKEVSVKILILRILFCIVAERFTGPVDGYDRRVGDR